MKLDFLTLLCFLTTQLSGFYKVQGTAYQNCYGKLSARILLSLGGIKT